jgi:phage/plasmid-like protein (TIGR03299 family)
MSHEIEQLEDGSYSMAYAGAVPWHGLGKAVPNDLTPLQMLKAAGLDWTVEKVPAYIKLPGSYGQPMSPTQEAIERILAGKVGEETTDQILYLLSDVERPIKRSALVRSSDQKILDVVTPDWNPLQNVEAFEFFKDFVMKGDMEMHTAGSLKGGQLVWALARVKEGFTVGTKKDEVESNLLFTNPHSYGNSIDIRFTPVRVVCANTLALALGSGRGLTVDQQVVRATHRQPFDADKVMQTLGLAHELLIAYKEAAQFIASKRFSDNTLNDYFREIFPKSGGGDEESVSRNHQQALGVINSMPGADMDPGSWWQAFNTVTYMTDHLMGRSNETRLDSAWFGSNRSLKSRALNLAVDKAKRSKDLIVA